MPKTHGMNSFQYPFAVSYKRNLIMYFPLFVIVCAIIKSCHLVSVRSIVLQKILICLTVAWIRIAWCSFNLFVMYCCYLLSILFVFLLFLLLFSHFFSFLLKSNFASIDSGIINKHANAHEQKSINTSRTIYISIDLRSAMFTIYLKFCFSFVHALLIHYMYRTGLYIYFLVIQRQF